MSKLLTILSRMGLVLLGLLFGVVILEVGFRILYPDPSPKLMNQGLQIDKIYGLSFIPKAEGWNTSLRGEYSVYVRINSQGLRDREYDYHKEEGTFRILILGDSFTAALQVLAEENFAKLLEAQLNKHYPQTKIEVINGGVVGYGTGNQLAYFTREGYKYQPDLVVLAFFVGNDMADNIGRPLYKLEDGELIPIEATYREEAIIPPWARAGSTFKNIRNFLYSNSRLYSVSIELLTFTAIQSMPWLAEFLVSMGVVEISQPLTNSGNLYAFRQLREEAWLMTEALILHLDEQVQAHGAQLLVVILPDEIEVDAKKEQEILETYSHLIKEQTITGPRPTTRLAQFLQQEDILYLSLLPALKAYQEGTQQSLYYRYDGHWTPAGHRAASQAIYDYLLENRDKLNNFPGPE